MIATQIESTAKKVTESSLKETPGSLAMSTYQGLRRQGLTETDIMAFAGEILSLVASEFRSQSPAE